MEIALINSSSGLGPTDAAFFARAVNVQMERDFAPAYGYESWPCVAYSKLPPSGAYPMFVLDDIHQPNALGYHDDLFGQIYGRVLAQGGACSQTLSHECVEMRDDADCSHWRPMPDGTEVAQESADPVEEYSYAIEVTLFGVTRSVAVSDFILPAWYDKDSPGPYDFLGKLPAPFTVSPGGYLIVRRDGVISQVFGERAAHKASKLGDRMSRTYRRVRVARG